MSAVAWYPGTDPYGIRHLLCHCGLLVGGVIMVKLNFILKFVFFLQAIPSLVWKGSTQSHLR